MRDAPAVPLRGAAISTRKPSAGRIETTTVQTFRDLLSARPFVPFRAVMSSGFAYDVRHPEVATLTRTSLLLSLHLGEEADPDVITIGSLRHVTTIEPIRRSQ